MKTYTFLFTDIVGSTPLWEQHRQEMPRVIARHNKIMRSAIEPNGGHVFKVEGDAFYAVFPSPGAAAAAAATAQRALWVEQWRLPGVDQVWVRMAVHIGDAEEMQGDFFGSGANVAARLREVALGGQVILSHQAAENAPPLPSGVSLRDLGEIGVKGLEHPVRISLLVIPDVPALALQRFQVQVGTVVVNCDPFRWPRNRVELLELHVSEESGPLYEVEVNKLEEAFDGATGSIHKTLAQVFVVQYTGGNPQLVLVTDFRGHVGRFAFKPTDGVDLTEVRHMPGRFVGDIRLVPID